MRQVKIFFSVIIGLVLVIAITFFLFNYLKPKYAGLYIESTPLATVYINGTQEGRTPYNKKDLKPGEAIIKLVPDSFNAPLAPYETKVNLVAGVQTVIRRDFGGTEETSSGEIISFEKIEKNQVSLAVVSVPDSTELMIDEKERAFTPHRTTSLLPGAHSLTLKAGGYQERQVSVRTYEGYKLTAVIKLAKATDVTGSEKSEGGSETVVEEEVKKVKILSTPVGFLRVRSEPSTLGKEIGTVDPGKEYELLEKDEESGWLKIKFAGETEEDVEGWVSNQYTQVLDSATPSAETKPTP